MAAAEKKGQKDMSEFVKALLENQGASKIPGEYDWFAPLLGDWDFDYRDREGGKERHVEGEWLFRRALDGTGIEDLFICPSRSTRESNPQPDGEYGAALRIFHPEKKVYEMVYTTRGYMTRLEVKKENDQIVCTKLDNPNEKWVFGGLTGAAFHWRNVTVCENGEWRTNCEVFAVRKKNRYYGDVYADCPVFDDGSYCLRLIAEADAEDLLRVYSDEKAYPFFNSDNCRDDFRYTSPERMREAVRYWLWEYAERGFVRWSIYSHDAGEVVGTIELFHRDAGDFFTDCGLLRLDLRSDYEKEDVIQAILRQISAPAFAMFSCRMLATKAVPEAEERIRALAACGYEKSDQALIGREGVSYRSYWVLPKRES